MVSTSLGQMLIDANIPDAGFEFMCMLEQAGCTRHTCRLTPEQEQAVFSMIQRRIAGEPLQYILGEWEFYGMRIFVGEGVLIPRADTETLVDAVLHWCKSHHVRHIIDLCTGSGCIALALKKHLPDVKISAVESSEKALSYARKNAEYHQLEINFIHDDVLKHITDTPADIIVSNPPYLTSDEMAGLQTEVRHEPALALAGGADGLRYYRTITNLWKSVLHPGGLLAFEIGWKQADAVSEILKSHHFGNIQIIQDLEHRPRTVTGEKF